MMPVQAELDLVILTCIMQSTARHAVGPMMLESDPAQLHMHKMS